MGSGALTHAVQLHEGDVDGHEVIVDFFASWCSSYNEYFAMLETQGFTNLLEYQLIGNRPPPGQTPTAKETVQY